MLAGTAPDAIDVLLGAAHLPATPLWWSAVAIGLLWLVGLVGAVRSRQLDAFTRIALLVVALVPPVIAVLASRFVVDVAGVGVRLEPTGWLWLACSASPRWLPMASVADRSGWWTTRG